MGTSNSAPTYVPGRTESRASAVVCKPVPSSALHSPRKEGTTQEPTNMSGDAEGGNPHNRAVPRPRRSVTGGHTVRMNHGGSKPHGTSRPRRTRGVCLRSHKCPEQAHSPERRELEAPGPGRGKKRVVFLLRTSLCWVYNIVNVLSANEWYA